MEVGYSPFPKYGSVRGDSAERLAKAHLNLQSAILKSKQKQVPRDVIQTNEEDIRSLQQQVTHLCGDGFKLSWCTEERQRYTWILNKLNACTEAMVSYCRKHLRTKDCPSPWQLVLHCDWLGLEDKKAVTFKYLLKHFKEAVLDVAFHKIPSSTLAQFLSCPNLVLDREVDAIRAIFRWFYTSPTLKTSAARDLVRFVRVERFSREEFSEIATVLRYLMLEVNVSEVFQTRHSRFQKWTRNFGVRIYLAYTRGSYVEVSELNVDRRRWELRGSTRLPSFQCETFTGDLRELVVVGDEDLALAFKNGQATPEYFSLSPEFLGPVAYRLVSGDLFAVQNVGWALNVWCRRGSEWILLGTRSAHYWLYNVQVFANQDCLVFAGKRDLAGDRSSPKTQNGTVRANLFAKKTVFVWTFNWKSRSFGVMSKYSGPDGDLKSLGVTSSAFWAAHSKTGRIWKANLIQNVWTETELNFSVGDRVLSSCYCKNFLLVLSCNMTRGMYLTLSTISFDPDPCLGIIGSMPFDFPKSQAQEFIVSTRFNVFSDKILSF